MDPASSPLPRLVLIGPPASGKGTQGRRLASLLGVECLSTGALLRDHMARETEIGRMARPILAKGGYLPDALMCDMIASWLGELAGGWILDGFPRSLGQAHYLDRVLGAAGRCVSGAIYLEAPHEVLRARIFGRVECPACRWTGGAGETGIGGICPDCAVLTEVRADDSEENFESRYRAFVASALPLVEDYRQRGLLYSCDATLSRDEVTSSLTQQLSHNGWLG